MADDETVPAQPELTQARLVWDDSAIATNFANVVNLQSTREQVDLLFGINRTWDPARGGPVTVALSNRIILSPLAAKRLSLALNGVLREYELRYGALDTGT